MKKSNVAIAIALLTSVGGINAAEQKVENITVTGTRSEQPKLRLPAFVDIVSTEEISSSGVSTLVQLLAARPGIQIKDSIGNGARGASVSMRGFGENSANNVLVLVDGRKLNNPSLAAPDLASIALADIERVEIIHGSAGTLYGDQATGGVINIITKNPSAFGGNIAVSIGSDSLRTLRGSVSQAYDNGISLRLAGETKETDNYRDNNDAEYTNVFADIAYKVKNGEVFLEYANVSDDLRLPGSLSLAQLAANRRQTNRPSDFSNQDTETLRVGGNYKLTEAWSVSAEFTDRETESKGSFFSAFTGVTEVQTLNARVIGDVPVEQGALLVTAGVDVQDSGYLFASFGTTNSSQEIVDVYAQAIYPVSKLLELTVGGRVSDLEDKNNATGVVTKDDANATQLGLAYAIEGGRIFIRRDEGFRWANADENGFTNLALNEILKPQQSESWELGGNKQFGAVEVSALVYKLSLDDEIFFDPTTVVPSAFFAGANINLPESTRTGGVISLAMPVSASVKLSGSYSFVEAQFDSGALAGKTVPFVAEDTAKVQLDYTVSEAWSLYVNAEYTGGRFQASDELNIAGKLGGYTVINANLRWQQEAIYVSARVNNLTGKEYEGFRSLFSAFPTPEETFELTLGYTF